MSFLSRYLVFRVRLAWLLAIGLLGFALYTIPLLSLVGSGFSDGRDVASLLHHQFFDPEVGPTIDDEDVPRVHGRVAWLGNIEPSELDECSGIAVSNLHDDLLWAHNDSGGAPRLYALNQRGEELGEVNVDVARADDWEDMAAFVLDGEPYLLIADTGDNYRWRRKLSLHVVREPTLAQIQERATLPVAWSIVYQYPDGYRDSEAIAVDTTPGMERVYLVSKRRVPAEVFSLSLRAAAEHQTARPEALLVNIPQPDRQDLIEDPEYGMNRSRPTAMDIQGGVAVVVTYQDAYVFRKQPGDSWQSAFGRLPTRILLPDVYGREAAALTIDGQRLFVAAEREGRSAAGLFAVELD